MKVKFKYGLKTYSGTVDEMTYGAFRKGSICNSRKYVRPTLTEHNAKMGAIMKNLSTIYTEALPAYVSDLGIYSERNGKENTSLFQLIPTRYANFVKMMFNWQKADPTHIDLTTVTIEDIMLSDAPVKNVKAAIEAGFLPRVSKINDLNHNIAEEE